MFAMMARLTARASGRNMYERGIKDCQMMSWNECACKAAWSQNNETNASTWYGAACQLEGR